MRKPFNLKYMNNGPGPGSYDHSILTSISTKSSMKGNNSQIESSSYKVNDDKKVKKLEIPGPGAYNPKNDTAGKENKTYYSSFVSKCNRDEYLQMSKFPGPGVYEIKRTLMQGKPFKTLGPYSSFAMPLERKTNKTRVLIEK